MTDQEFNDKVQELRANGVEIDRPVKEHDSWTFGERVHVIEDDEDQGIYAEENGTLIIEEVGDAQYGNLQVKLFILPDGQDGPLEVPAWNLEATADDPRL